MRYLLDDTGKLPVYEANSLFGAESGQDMSIQEGGAYDLAPSESLGHDEYEPVERVWENRTAKHTISQM